MARLTQVTRIIAGVAGSILLKGPAKATRPTTDRVKESLFARLESWGLLEGARVLDLYAGTGALGLEAASRGAQEVHLVEKDKAAADVIAANISAIKKPLEANQNIALHRQETRAYLRKATGVFDLVFIDPPYDLDSKTVQQDLELLLPHLSADSLIVLERATKNLEVLLPAGFIQLETKKYGDTSLVFLEKD